MAKHHGLYFWQRDSKSTLKFKYVYSQTNKNIGLALAQSSLVEQKLVIILDILFSFQLNKYMKYVNVIYLFHLFSLNKVDLVVYIS